MTKETKVGTIFVPDREHWNQTAEAPATSRQRPGIGHNRPPEDPPPYFVTYPELAALGVRYSRKHLLELMRQHLFPPAYQLSANRVGWRYDDIIAYRESRPLARAALFQQKKGAKDIGDAHD